MAQVRSWAGLGMHACSVLALRLHARGRSASSGSRLRQRRSWNPWRIRPLRAGRV